VVSKVRDSTYTSGRSNAWVKKTSPQRETLTIAGFALDGTKWDGISRPPRGQGLGLCGKGRPRSRQVLGRPDSRLST
jgi:bifunctional non-homologous end joining protein LigD